MPDRVLVITVGTSLFTSASWRPEGPFSLIEDYRSWCEKNLLTSPAARRASSSRTEAELEERLKARYGNDVHYFAWPPGPPLRYSAEITTLLRWMQKEGSRDLPPFLERTYQRIDLVCPSDEEDRARVAADHLHAVLTSKLGLRHVELRNVLTSRSIEEKVAHFQSYLTSLDGQPSDLVVSGGYKVFAMYAALAVARAGDRRPWQIIYVHEESLAELIVQGAGEIEIEGRMFRVTPPAIIR